MSTPTHPTYAAAITPRQLTRVDQRVTSATDTNLVPRDLEHIVSMMTDDAHAMRRALAYRSGDDY